jgi:hypothetical protein
VPGDRLDQVVAAHLQKAPVVEAVLADEDRVDRGLHVVVDAAPAASLEEGERPVVRVEHHLLALARVGPHEQHPAVAESHVRDPDAGRDPVEHHELVAPVELIGFSRSEAQRYISDRRLPVPLAPPTRIAAHRVVAALVTARAQLLEDADQRQPLAKRLGGIAGQKFVELCHPSTQLRPRLDLPLVCKARLSGPQHLADRVPGHLEVPGDPSDRLALKKMLPPYPANRVHRQHASPARSESGASSATGQNSGGQFWTPIPPLRGSKLHAE